ncbi:MAG: xanthine dehydrogenase family protein molybdopterin-binding subunit [Clostridia bacterium]|nr:xanthine dehydrogenase family protein molybdopterin-binding subunit [Clostridia bacterium]
MCDEIYGHNIPMVDGYEKVTGRAIYATDVMLPDMLYGKILRSPYAHARILSIDTSAAEALPGVVAVVTNADTARRKFSSSPYLDQYLFAEDEVRFIGDEVAAVAATDLRTAEEACALIKVEYEPLPAVFSIEEAMQPDAPLVHTELSSNIAHEIHYDRGDIDSAWKDCAVVVEETFQTSSHHPAYIEPQAAVASVDWDDNVEVFAGTQCPAGAPRERASEITGIPISKIRIHQTFVGGGFGGKVWQHIIHVAIVLSKKARKPVKVVYERAEDLSCTPPRVPMKLTLKMGADKEGHILAKETLIEAENGAYTINASVVVDTTATRVESLYRFKNIRDTARLIYTNKVPTGTFRGFGNPQGTFMVECVMDMLAEKLGMDPTQIRLINASQPGDVTAHEWKIGSCELSQCIHKAAALSGWEEKKRNKRYGHGIGMGCCIHVNGNRSVFPAFDGSTATIRMNENGKAELMCADGDIGQGASTVFAMIAAKTIGIPARDVRILRVDSAQSGFGFGAFASRITLNAGNAVLDAAQKVHMCLCETAAKRAGCEVEAVRIENGLIYAPGGYEESVAEVSKQYMYSRGGIYLKQEGSFMPSGVRMADKKTKLGNISAAYSFASHVAEVDIDLETGKLSVVNYVGVHDTGNVINPMLAEGQIEGGVVQGLGYAIYEDYYFDKDGRMLNTSFLDYKLPTTMDIPPIHSAFAQSFEQNGPYGAKGLGEPTIVPVAAAVANAIYDAIGVRITDMPFTPEHVWRVIKEEAAKKEAHNG